MRLTSFTDYCLRALIYVALKGGEIATVDEIAERYRILVRETEDDLALVECFQDGDCLCVIEPACVLRKALHQALEAFLRTLDGYTIADLLKPGRNLARLLALPQPGDRP